MKKLFAMGLALAAMMMVATPAEANGRRGGSSSGCYSSCGYSGGCGNCCTSYCDTGCSGCCGSCVSYQYQMCEREVTCYQTQQVPYEYDVTTYQANYTTETVKQKYCVTTPVYTDQTCYKTICVPTYEDQVVNCTTYQQVPQVCEREVCTCTYQQVTYTDCCGCCHTCCQAVPCVQKVQYTTYTCVPVVTQQTVKVCRMTYQQQAYTYKVCTYTTSWAERDVQISRCNYVPVVTKATGYRCVTVPVVQKVQYCVCVPVYTAPTCNTGCGYGCGGYGCGNDCGGCGYSSCGGCH